MKHIFCTAIGATFLASSAIAAPVGLGTWTAESYDSVNGFGDGVWTVSGDSASVFQSINGQPTVFYSDFTAQGTKVTGTITPNAGAGDDDFIGFVLGFDPGDSSSAAADYLLVDWKRLTQNFNFGGGAASSTTGGIADIGLALSRVNGIPTADELWQHKDLVGNPGGGVTELARGATLGSTGWSFGESYDFSFDFGPNNLIISVDGIEQFNVTGSFENGRLGFYNFSQRQITYSAFEVEEGSFDVPLPAAGWLMIAGLGAMGAMRRKKR